MKIDLKKYFEERDKVRAGSQSEGPVVTLSREYGCEANRIAGLLIQRLNDFPSWQSNPRWRYISKEIIDESARELGLKPTEVDQRILQHSSDTVNNIFQSFDHHYSVSDRVILNKVKEVIKTYATKGHVIIIGRGGGLLTQEMQNALRVRLMAPLSVRAQHIGRSMSLDMKEAEMLVSHFDENRIRWMEHLSGVKYEHTLFDLLINVHTLSDKEIVDVIFKAMEDKGMLAGKDQKAHVVS